MVSALVVLLAQVAVTAGDDTGLRFGCSVDTELKQMLFGNATVQGWFGSDLALSVRSGERFLWFFGDTLVSGAPGGHQGRADAGTPLCNYVPSATCSMPPQTLGIWQPPSPGVEVDAAMKFWWPVNEHTAQAVPIFPIAPTLQPNSTKGVHCDDCRCLLPELVVDEEEEVVLKLVVDEQEWQANHTEWDCNHVPSQCCHTLEYLWMTSALSSRDQRRLAILADVSLDADAQHPAKDYEGWCRKTMLVVVENGDAPPKDWRYSMRVVPHTGPWCFDTIWSVSMSWADPDPESMDDTVLVVGNRGKGEYIAGDTGTNVLARVSMSDLLSFNFDAWQFWCGEGCGWVNDRHKLVPLMPSFEGAGETEGTLQWHPPLQRWIFPVASQPELYIHTAPEAVGPWSAHAVEGVPEMPEGWSFRTAKSHPELAQLHNSTSHDIVLSVILDYNGAQKQPPLSGYAPHLWRVFVKESSDLVIT